MTTQDPYDPYVRTDVSIVLPDLGWVGAHGALGALRVPVFVLTAWNPKSSRPGIRANRRRNRALYERLREHSTAVYPALGGSDTGDHYEESYAALGLTRAAAVEFGREFGQEAVFELVRWKQTVVGCDGTWERSRELGP